VYAAGGEDVGGKGKSQPAEKRLGEMTNENPWGLGQVWGNTKQIAGKGEKWL